MTTDPLIFCVCVCAAFLDMQCTTCSNRVAVAVPHHWSSAPEALSPKECWIHIYSSSSILQFFTVIFRRLLYTHISTLIVCTYVPNGWLLVMVMIVSSRYTPSPLYTKKNWENNCFYHQTVKMCKRKTVKIELTTFSRTLI